MVVKVDYHLKFKVIKCCVCTAKRAAA